MNCKNCGFQLQNGDMFCKNCGAKTEGLGGQNMTGGPVMDSVQSNTVPNTQFGVQPTVMPNMQEPVQPTHMANDYIQPQPMPMPNSYVPLQPSMMQQQGQPNMMGGTPAQSGYNNSGTKSKSIYVIIGLVVAIIALVVILVLKNGSTSNGSGGIANGGKVVTNQTYSVHFKGFKFKIPTNYLYEKRTSSVSVGDEESTWLFYIEVMEVPFSQIQANKNQLTLGFKNAGYNASNLNQKTYGGLDFITVELAKGGEKAVAGITKANSMYSFGITAVNASGTIDYNILTKAAEILKTAEYSDVSNSITINSEIDLSQIIQSLNENTNPEISVDDATVPVE